MKNLRTVVFTILLTSASTLSWAQTPDEHNVHHPDVATTGQAPNPTPSIRADSASLEKDMATQMKAMHDLHEQFQNASPDERQALMSKHHNLMHEGMQMMDMASAEMRGMRMMNTMPEKTSSGSPTVPSAADHTMMLKRMDMMESMMQLMVDRMSALPATTQ